MREADVLVLEPPEPCAGLVLAHGAGAGMRHEFMEDMARRLQDRGVATLRYEFPYMAARTRRPDPPALLVATVREAVAIAEHRWPSLPLFAGGKSMGGRMTSTAAAQEPGLAVSGIVFLGFPLHPAGRPGIERARHLDSVQLPLLFIQGTRDKLASVDLLAPVIGRLGSAASVMWVDGADHGFGVLRSSGMTADAVRDAIAGRISDWTRMVGAE